MKKRLLIWMTVMSVVVLAGCGSTEKKVDNAGDTQAASVETTQQIEDTQSAKYRVAGRSFCFGYACDSNGGSV